MLINNFLISCFLLSRNVDCHKRCIHGKKRKKNRRIPSPGSSMAGDELLASRIKLFLNAAYTFYMTCASYSSLSFSLSLSLSRLFFSSFEEHKWGSQDVNPRNHRLAKSYLLWPSRTPLLSKPTWKPLTCWFSPRKTCPWRTDPPPPILKGLSVALQKRQDCQSTLQTHKGRCGRRTACVFVFEYCGLLSVPFLFVWVSQSLYCEGVCICLSLSTVSHRVCSCVCVCVRVWGLMPAG